MFSVTPVARKNKHTFAISSRRRAAIFALCLLAAILFIWLDHSPIRHTWQAQPKSTERTQAYDFQKYHEKTFTVINVVDGDTIDIDVPDGNFPRTRIRLWGVDTPETKNPKIGVMYFGLEASAFTKELAFEKPVAIYLDEENHTRDKYGRLLAYVLLPDGRFLNEVLLEEGYAYADTRFRHSFYNNYKQLEASARSQMKGFWLNVTREQMPQWRREK